VNAHVDQDDKGVARGALHIEQVYTCCRER
jgi:hypothetical protein